VREFRGTLSSFAVSKLRGGVMQVLR
jgi:hypothetical protein